MSGTKDGRGPSGFSLVEVMTALVITMIIAGSIYGLLTAGQKAFRREPERTELQQNVRGAMDIIMRDVSNAGGGPGCDSSGVVCDGIQDFLQVFTPAMDGTGPPRPGGGNSDVLEMLYADASCAPIPYDLASRTLVGALKLPSCFAASSSSIVFVSNPDKTRTYWGLATALVPGGNAVPFATSQPVGANATLAAGTPASVSVGKLVRYEICTAVGDTVPSLCRSETGGYDVGGTFQAAPSAAGGWQVVARGIEDLQVDYRSASAVPTWLVDTGPTVVSAADWSTITKELRVTLSGRGTLTRIEGQRGPAGVAQTLREQLVSTGSPRAALFWLRTQSTPTNILWSSLIPGPGAWS